MEEIIVPGTMEEDSDNAYSGGKIEVGGETNEGTDDSYPGNPGSSDEGVDDGTIVENVKYGFYNSRNGDRKYKAEDFTSMFDGLIADGIFGTIGKAFAIKEYEDFKIVVGAGKAWFNHTWTSLAVDTILELGSPDPLKPRMDVVFLETNSADSVRANRISYKEGTPASTPIKPELERGEFINQYPLAYIRRNPNSTKIENSDITIAVGTPDCPIVTGIIDTIDIVELQTRWDGQITQWLEDVGDEWNKWFNGTKADWERWYMTVRPRWEAWYQTFIDELTEQQATNLQRQINELRDAYDDSYKIVSIVTSDNMPSVDDLKDNDICLVYYTGGHV